MDFYERKASHIESFNISYGRSKMAGVPTLWAKRFVELSAEVPLMSDPAE
jgi:hypothetical protein